MYSAPGINLQLMDMPTSVKGTSTQNADGSYTIFINTKLNNEQQTNAYMHELKHILRLDFETAHEDVSVLEYYAHKVG